MFFFPYIAARWHPLYVFALSSSFSFPRLGLCLSAVLAGLAPTQQRANSSERDGLLPWRKGREARSHQSLQSFQSSGKFVRLGMRGSESPPCGHAQTRAGKRAPVLSTVAIDPHQLYGKTNPVYKFLSAMTPVKSVSVVISAFLLF